MEFIDSHCHLDFARIGHLASVIEQSKSLGVRHFVVPSVDRNNWHEVLALGDKYPEISVALGVHPYFLSADNQMVRLIALATLHRDKLVAIGEVGLDGAIDTPLSIQLDVLKPQLKLACDLELPVICHAHKAYDPLLKQLRHFRPKRGGVVHAFSGSLVQAKEFIKLGFKLGVGGVITYERAKKTRRVFADIGLEHLILETDAPDMPIFGQQGQANSPRNLVKIAHSLALLTQHPIETVSKVTTENSKNLFSLSDIKLPQM